jgi:hypothetical protein
MMKGGDDMKKATLSVGVSVAVLAASAFGAGQKFTCRLTGKRMDKCCCEMKDGKFYCKLTKKTYDHSADERKARMPPN